MQLFTKYVFRGKRKAASTFLAMLLVLTSALILPWGGASVTQANGSWDLTLDSLKSTYNGYFLVGNIISSPSQLDNTSAVAMLKYHYNTLTAENHNKPGYTVNSSGTYTLNDITRMANWSEVNGIAYIAHTLVWHSQSSSWLHGSPSSPLTRALAKTRMEAYINQVAGTNGIKGKAYAWDVVNEAFVPGVNNYSGDWRSHLRTSQGGNDASAWYAAYANGAGAGESGADYIYDAFVFARQADPSATLYYNDFNDEQIGKSHAIAAMVKELNLKWKTDSRNTNSNRLLIEGIGLQSHYNTNISTDAVENAIIHYITENPGIKLSVTELDITIAGTSESVKPTQQQFVKQAIMYAELFEIYKKYAAGPANTSGNPKVIERVTFWGTDDSSSWRSFGQNGGTGGYPTLFHGNYTAKEAYYAVIDPADYLRKNAPDEVEIKMGTATHTATPPTLNGTSTLWAAATPLSVNLKAVGNGAATGQARILWDANNLYVRVDVTDNNVNVSAADDWEKDSVEVYVSEVDYRGAYSSSQGNQYRITANGLKSQKSGEDSSWTGYAGSSSNGYFTEFAIPWTGNMKANSVIGFDIQINDPPPSSSRPQITWNDPDASGYNSSKNWGRVTLSAGQVNPNPSATISISKADFNKSNPANIAVGLTLNGHTLVGIKNGNTSLVQGTDYTVSGTTVTLLSTYLAKQPLGTTNLTFDFSGGTDPTLAITIKENSNVVTGDIKVEMFNGSTAATTNGITPKIRITNTGTGTVNLSDVKVRYYFTVDSESAQTFWCDWSSAGTGNVTGSFTRMATATVGADHYLEIGFGSAAGSLAAGQSTEIHARFSKTNWVDYTQGNDYSFRSSGSSYAEWTSVTAYVAGNLAWGIEP